ncbi:hypothetical protein [Shewanella algidipiscicola]|uniref:Uncharacterized protein n=1 Tax=Shewanella algidipiscicola TaxID=614070 RepID=A0ABQ4PD61_9GAMM|nr:hypothetical protein [Shewanella algidipiscicola]GIU45465.1 hypothetical protein TUM4630_13630 [Shewanella algidipiscicola]
MMKQSIAANITPAQAITNEANRLIATLKLATPADSEMVEVALESLKAVAEVIAPSLAKTLGIRIIAIRNNIHVNQVQVA